MRTAKSSRILTGAALAAAILGATGIAYGNTITVNSTADVAANDGQCTLREAIVAANTNTASGAAVGECAAGSPGLDTIAFNIPGAGVHTITPGSNLPLLTEPVIIDGYTQPANGGPAASPNTNPFPGPLNTVLLIELVKTTTSFSVDAAGTTIRGLIIHGSGDNIDVNANNVTITGNFLGTNATGTAAANSAPGDGVFINTGNNTVIGGPNPADRNLICNNGTAGVIGGLAGVGLTIRGNFIGTDVTGTAALNPLSGVGFRNGQNVMIIQNLISGNTDGGIVNVGPGTGPLTIQGNMIGTQRDGTSPLPNGNSGGIYLQTDNNIVGRSGAGQGNLIAFNTGWGIDVVGNNNLISENSIFGNTFLGITLTASNVPLPNDNCDADSGPGNGRANYPVITSAVVAAGSVTISGTLNSTAGTDFTIEFFSNASCDPSGNGEGQTFIGSASVTTPVGACDVSFGPLVFPVPPGQTIFTATATGKAPGNNTSEFSQCFSSQGVATATPTSTPTNTPTFTPTSTPVGVATSTPTNTPTTTPTQGGTPAAVVPMLMPGLLALLGLALAAAALFLIRRSG